MVARPRGERERRCRPAAPLRKNRCPRRLPQRRGARRLFLAVEASKYSRGEFRQSHYNRGSSFSKHGRRQGHRFPASRAPRRNRDRTELRTLVIHPPFCHHQQVHRCRSRHATGRPRDACHRRGHRALLERRRPVANHAGSCRRKNNRTLWRDTLNVAAPDMIAMRGQITAKVRQGLVPALGAGVDSGETETRPSNEEAYDLYLRSLARPHDPGPNKEAIPMLERAVGLDPSYAPAWGNLGRRYYLDSQYGGGGEASFQKSNAALERALALDPNLSIANGQIIANRVERGDLVQAYKDAQDFLKRQPKNATAHFVTGYVLRYAGLLDESARECEDALSLDPGNYLFRACSFTFGEMGNEERAMDFIRLDAGSNFFNANVLRILAREGKLAEVRQAAQKLPQD